MTTFDVLRSACLRLPEHAPKEKIEELKEAAVCVMNECLKTGQITEDQRYSLYRILYPKAA